MEAMAYHRHASDMIIDNLTGNIAQLPDSVVLNIESTDSSSSERFDEDIGDIVDDNGEDEDEDDRDDGDGDDDPDDGKYPINFT